MFGIPSPRADDRAVLAFQDLASAMDAGLPPSQLGAPADPQEDWTRIVLADRGVRLSAAEQTMLQAATRSGNLPAVLRQRAQAREFRAETVRQCLSGLRYPLLLLLMSGMVSLTIAVAQGNRVPVYVMAAVLVVLVLVVVCGWRSLDRPEGFVHRLPGLRQILHDLGELPYLQTLEGLYSSGVPLRDAHPEATAASPVARVRLRLLAADPILQRGVPLADALRQAGALHPETQGLLATGEQSGDLEDALRRAARRRGDQLRQRTVQWVKTVSIGLYAFAVLVAVYLIFSFYSNYLGMIRGLR